MIRHLISVFPDREDLGDTPEQQAQIARAITAALDHQNIAIPCCVNVLLTDDAGIQALNAEHRNLDRPTDVLSFPLQDLVPGEAIEPTDADCDPESGAYLLGDMAISLERASAQAEEYGHSLARELSFLAVHSILHLLGYDHERSPEEEALQFSLTEEILVGIGLPRTSDKQ